MSPTELFRSEAQPGGHHIAVFHTFDTPLGSLFLLFEHLQYCLSLRRWTE
jgi:hypothetical protein